MSHIVIERNLLPQLLNRLPDAVQNRTTLAMEGGRGAARGALADGNRPHNDTMALSDGIVLSTPGESDEAERRSEAQNAYLDGRDGAKARAQFEALCGHALQLAKTGEFEALAALSVLMAYGALWENGHNNLFTGQYEHAPWFAQAIYGWAVNGLASAYDGVIEEVLR